MQKSIGIYNISLKLSVLATALCSGTLAVLLSDIIADYSLVGTQEGLMSSMVSIGGFLALLTFVFLQGKFKKTTVIIGGGFLAACVAVAMGVDMRFSLFLLCCLVMGFGYGAMDSFQSSFIADLNPQDTAKQMGAVHGTFGLGGILTPIFLHALLQRAQWRIVYVVVGAVAFVLVAQFAVVSWVMQQRLNIVSRKESKFTASGLADFFKNPYAILVVFCISFGAAAQSGIIVWIVRYVTVEFSRPDLAAICLSLFWVACMVSRFCAPLLPLRPNQILAYGALITAVIWGTALFVNNPTVLCAACALAGLASGPCIPMSLSEGAGINPQNTGLSTNLLMMFKTVAQILSPIVLAFVASLTNLHIGMFITCAFFLINFVFAFFMMRQKRES